MTPRDSWDYENTAQITMADLTTDVQKRHVAVHASNNGSFYVLDVKEGTRFASTAAAAPTPAYQGG
jgi:glucose dehydrogenase